MQVEVDQSGRVEHTKHQTVVAFSDGGNCSFAVKIKAQDKRFLVRFFRQKHLQPEKFYIEIFCALLALLLSRSPHKVLIGTLVIDSEYLGKNRLIERTVYLYCDRLRVKAPESISFGFIGKKSPAHDVAIRTFRGNDKPNVELTAEYVKRQIKKIGYL